MGAGGRLGRPVVAALNQAGVAVRAIERTARSGGADVEVVVADVEDREALTRALDGCDAVHISVSGPSEGIAAENVARVAKDLSISRVGYISGSATFEHNAGWPVVKTKLTAERALRDSGVGYTIFCPSFAMEVLPMHVGGGRATYFGRQPYPFHWLAADDLADVVVRALADPGAAGERYFVRGPEALSMRETLERYCDALHPEMKVSSMPFWMASALAFVLRNRELKIANEVYRMYEGVGGDGGDPGSTNDRFGAPSTTLDVWLERKRSEKSPQRPRS